MARKWKALLDPHATTAGFVGIEAQPRLQTKALISDEVVLTETSESLPVATVTEATENRP